MNLIKVYFFSFVQFFIMLIFFVIGVLFLLFSWLFMGNNKRKEAVIKMEIM